MCKFMYVYVYIYMFYKYKCIYLNTYLNIMILDGVLTDTYFY